MSGLKIFNFIVHFTLRPLRNLCALCGKKEFNHEGHKGLRKGLKGKS